MTRVDYNLIATAIHEARRDVDCENAGWPADSKDYKLRGMREAAVVLSDAFATKNPRFDRVRFLKACGF